MAELGQGVLEYNTEELRLLSDRIQANGKKLGDKKEELLSEVSDLSTFWQGTAYDSFKLLIDNFCSTKVEPIVKEIQDKWPSEINAVAESGDETTRRNINIIEG
jgi:uncharacterized protein YukE